MSGSDAAAAAGSAAAPRLALLTRADCGLCGQFLDDLSALGARFPVPPVTLIDVDSDPELARRWGLKVPVLLLEGALVCGPRLDAPELLRLLRL